MERYILGIDIGTTSVKVLLISESGALAAEGKADHDLISAHPGWAEENAEVWWSNAVAAVRQITDAHPDMAENIVSAGVSGMVPALVLLDHDGKPVRNTIQQNDARAVAQIEKLTALLDQDELYERTGTCTNQQHVLPRLLWVKENEPEVFARSEYVVGSYEFVTGRMTGARYIESNWAVESGLYDIRRQCWMTEQFSVLGVDKGYFPPVIASHEKALAFAQELQSPLMQLISGGALLEDDPEQSRSRSMDGICRLTKLAERAGVKLVLEADPNCTIANTNDQLRAIREIASPQLSGMIEAGAVNSTEVFSISVTSASPEEAEKIANTIAELLPNRIADIVEGSSVRIVDYAVVPSKKTSPSLSKNTMLGAMLGFVLSCGVFTVLYLLDDVVHNEDYVRVTFDLPLLAVVPDLTEKNSKSNYYYYRDDSKGGKEENA